MSWVGVITNIGESMLQSVAGGSSMTVTSVKTGTGYVSSGSMKEQTDLQEEVTTGQISKQVLDNGVNLTSVIGPYESSYSMKEVGIFARIGEGDPSLFVLLQNTDGISVPDIDDFPDFTYAVTAFVAIQNTDSITLEIDPNAFVASSVFETAIADINSEIDDIEGDISNLQTAVDGKASKSEAVKMITRNGLTFTATRTNDTTFTFTQQDTTYNDVAGATGTSAGTRGLVPAPAAGKQRSFLRGDGTWDVPAVYTGASASSAGSAGLVKAPASGEQNKFLKGDGSWGIPTDTTYSTATDSTLGLVKIGYTASGKNYPVQLDNGKMYVNVPWTDTNTDTKNTAGSTDTSSKIFLIGATSQAANPQTYSHDTAYVGTDGCLYSGGVKVLTAHQDISGKKNTQSAVSDPSASGTSITFIKSISQNAQGVISPAKSTVSTMGGASSSAAGSVGLVPAPAKGAQGLFLRGDGTWQTPTNTTYSGNNGVGLSGTTFYNSGVRAVSISGNYLRVNTNGTNADLTIPYATSAGGVAWGNVSGKPSSYYTLPTASSSALGGVKTGFSTNASARNYAVALSDGKMYVNVPWTDTNTTYGEASSSAYGLVKTGYTSSGKNYAVQLSSGQMYVNVPWTDTNTTYSANNGVGLSGTTFYNSGVRSATINGNYLRVNTNGTNADLTIPYATSAGSANAVAWSNVSSKPASYPGGCTGTAGGVAWGNVSSKPSTTNGLTDTSTTNFLSANMGRVLNGRLASASLFYFGANNVSKTMTNPNYYTALVFVATYEGHHMTTDIIPTAALSSGYYLDGNWWVSSLGGSDQSADYMEYCIYIYKTNANTNEWTFKTMKYGSRLTSIYVYGLVGSRDMPTSSVV